MNAHYPTHSPELEAMTLQVGLFPRKHDTVRAEVLAQLMDGRIITSMSAVFNSSTTRLAAVVHALRKSYKWAIESVEQVVSTNDGRMAEVSAYRLPSQIAMKAMAQGGAEYCASVTAARQALRQAKGA